MKWTRIRTVVTTITSLDILTIAILAYFKPEFYVGIIVFVLMCLWTFFAIVLSALWDTIKKENMTADTSKTSELNKLTDSSLGKNNRQNQIGDNEHFKETSKPKPLITNFSVEFTSGETFKTFPFKVKAGDRFTFSWRADQKFAIYLMDKSMAQIYEYVVNIYQQNNQKGQIVYISCFPDTTNGRHAYLCERKEFLVIVCENTYLKQMKIDIATSTG